MSKMAWMKNFAQTLKDGMESNWFVELLFNMILTGNPWQLFTVTRSGFGFQEGFQQILCMFMLRVTNG
jgi:hypothetical protein